jgi:hypothetical protein
MFVLEIRQRRIELDCLWKGLWEMKGVRLLSRLLKPVFGDRWGKRQLQDFL